MSKSRLFRRRADHINAQNSGVGRSLRLSRRTFLGGAALALSLPLLDIMRPTTARGAGVESPTRLVFWYLPNGIRMDHWTPKTEGIDYDLPRILAPLDGIQHKVNVISGLANASGHPDEIGDHASGTGAYLTCFHVKKTKGADIQNAVSVDQIAANALAARDDYVRFPSLELGISGGASVGGCDSGYSCAYTRNISWSGPQTPRPKIVNPRVVFDRLFGGDDGTLSAKEQARRALYRTSVLDHIRGEAKTLHSKLGMSDRLKMDEYLTGVRALERRVEAPPVDLNQCVPIDAPVGPYLMNQRVDLMNQMTVLAMRCDLTRYVTFMLANAGSNRGFEFLGVTGSHHELSHHQNDAGKLESISVINKWEVEQYASLLKAMDAVKEGDGTLLDNSLVFLSSEIEDGNAHRHSNLPVLLGGRGGGTQSGRHLRVEAKTPMANLYLSMLQRGGVNQESFGDSTGPLAGL